MLCASKVSYTEFYDLVTDPDPGRPDFGKPGVADEKVEAKKNAGDQMKRQRELGATKRKLGATAAADFEVESAAMCSRPVLLESRSTDDGLSGCIPAGLQP